MTTKKSIILMRHADSLPALEGGDINKKLSPKGIKQAEDAACFLAKFDIDKILVSPATRTKQTLSVILKQLNVSDIEEKEDLYQEGGNHKILKLIINQSNDVKNLMLIGHNPSICMLAFDIVKTTDKDYEHLMQTLMPPATVIIIDIPNISSWDELKNEHIGNIKEVFTPV